MGATGVSWREWLRRPRLTVLMPLHGALPWIDDISANIELIPAGARIVLSDETESDDALARLLDRHRGDPRVRGRRPKRSDNPGWRAHANALLGEARTELIALLPQDDRIMPSYYEKLVEALDRTPGAGLAFGSIEAIGYATEPTRFPGPPIPLGVQTPWEEAIELDRRWNLGIAYRGVARRGLVRPIPATPSDRFADQMWVFSIALVSYLVEVPDATYIKRYHVANTHTRWSPLTPSERLAALSTAINERLEGEPRARCAALALGGAS